MCCILLDFSCILQIIFVAYNDNWCVLIFDFVDWLDPVADGLERVLVGHVKTDDDSVSLSVELVSDVSELFLAGSVPDFNCDSPIILNIMVLILNEIHCDRL